MFEYVIHHNGPFRILQGMDIQEGLFECRALDHYPWFVEVRVEPMELPKFPIGIWPDFGSLEAKPENKS